MFMNCMKHWRTGQKSRSAGCTVIITAHLHRKRCAGNWLNGKHPMKDGMRTLQMPAVAMFHWNCTAVSLSCRMYRTICRKSIMQLIPVRKSEITFQQFGKSDVWKNTKKPEDRCMKNVQRTITAKKTPTGVCVHTPVGAAYRRSSMNPLKDFPRIAAI